MREYWLSDKPCPKCGNERSHDLGATGMVHSIRYHFYKCGSEYNIDSLNVESLHQSHRCRILELEAEVKLLKFDLECWKSKAENNE